MCTRFRNSPNFLGKSLRNQNRPSLNVHMEHRFILLLTIMHRNHIIKFRAPSHNYKRQLGSYICNTHHFIYLENTWHERGTIKWQCMFCRFYARKFYISWPGQAQQFSMNFYMHPNCRMQETCKKNYLFNRIKNSPFWLACRCVCYDNYF